MKKKYIFIVPSLSKGGAEKVVSLLSNELVNNDREVYIITHFKTKADYLVDCKVNVICLSELYEEDYRKKINALYLILLMKKLRKEIIKVDPDYIIPFLWTTCFRTELALTFTKYKKRIIQTVRNNPAKFPNNKFLKLIRNYLIKKSRISIVQNENQKKYFDEKFVNNNIKILPNPVDKSIYDLNTIKQSKVKIIGVGRLEVQKNFDLLIDSFFDVYQFNKNIELVIYGEGSLKNHLQKKIDELNLNDCVTLFGRSNDYNLIYGTASIFVLSSNFEGMPNTLLEAMAAGLPCISTDCPTGPNNIIDNWNNGILINVNDRHELTNSLNKLLNDSKLSKMIGKNAKQFIKKNYLPENICKLFIQICEEGEFNE